MIAPSQLHNQLGNCHWLPLAFLLLAGCGDGNQVDASLKNTQDKLAPYLNASPSYVQGIDVSHWNGDIDWAAVSKDKVTFAYIKATEGISSIDTKFTSNWNNSTANNIINGGYHVFTPGEDGKEQAQHFLDTISSIQEGYIGALPPVLDIEQIPANQINESGPEIQDWLTTVQDTLGCSPLIYTSPDTWDGEFSGKFTAYRLWLADYDLSPTLPTGWDSWLFWQFTNKEKKPPKEPDTTGKKPPNDTKNTQYYPDFGNLRYIDGISGNTDLNLFNGSISTLLRTTCSGEL